MNEIEWITSQTGMKAEYLGDAVYASFDGYQIWLYTTNGIYVTNKIALEPEVWGALMRFKKDLGNGKKDN